MPYLNKKPIKETIHKKLKKPLRCALLLFVMTLYGTQQASAIKIIPPRLVIKTGERVEYMFVKNNSEKTESFRFGWKNLAMNKEGNVLNLDKVGMDQVPAYKPASKIIRFSPRRTTLKAGETQRIAFVTRRSPEYQDGEYRSHFFIEKIPTESQPDADNAHDIGHKEDLQNEGPLRTHSSVAVDVLISRAVPIYVLNGETQASIKLVDVSLDRNPKITRKNQPKNIVNFRVQKTGNRSIIGVANVFCKKGNDEIKINKISKIFAIYAEADFKEDKVSFDIPNEGCSSMYLKLEGHGDDVLSGQVLAERSIEE